MQECSICGLWIDMLQLVASVAPGCGTWTRTIERSCDSVPYLTVYTGTLLLFETFRRLLIYLLERIPKHH